MDIEHLVHMANRIGEFFQAMPDREEATTEIAQHIHKFWEPRMRRELLAQLDTPATAHLLPLVADAVRAHRLELA